LACFVDPDFVIPQQFSDTEHISSDARITMLLMAEKLYYCDTCNVPFTGPQPASQHYSGSKHRKKEASKLAQSSMMFPAAVGESTAVGYSTDTSASGLERQTGSINLTGGLASSCSADSTKCENTSTSVEAAPTCNVVMVPSLNPDLPPVPVMMENALPQTEYEFDGSSGSCHLCNTQLTSQQHAHQHLSGQKHLKAKKRWEVRREQLQLTVSGLCQSMKSKPIALCHPHVSDSPTKDSISDVCKWNSSRSVPAAATTADVSSNIVDGMQWFSCEVCNKKMNTVDMLELHQRSPAHQKKVDRQQLGAVSADNTVWQLCPVCRKKLNSPSQLEIHLNSHSRPTNYPPVRTDGRTVQTTAEPGAQWCLYDKHVNTAAHSELDQPSPTHPVTAVQQDMSRSVSISDNTVWQTCQLCNKRVNSLKQLDIHVKSHGLAGRSLLNDVDTGYQHRSTADAAEMFRNMTLSLSAAAGNISPPIEFADRIDVENSLKFVNQLQMKEETSAQTDDAAMSESSMRPQSGDNNRLNTRNSAPTVCDTSANPNHTASQMKFTSDAVVVAAAANDDDDDVTMSENQPLRPASIDSKAPWTSENSPSPATCQTDVKSAATTADDVAADAGQLVTDNDLITTGCCTFTGCVYHCELCDVHLSGDEPRNMHLTGLKHISCRQKAEGTASSEKNPFMSFSPNFRYHCQLCNVPFNTLKDKNQHERGQQHISKSARYVPAPERLMPDVVLPTDTDNCSPDNLVTSTPRSYQAELYHKALVADSVCFLPTGE